MSQLVCFDTHVLIWGIQQNARSSQQTMIPKSKHFIENLSDNNMRAIIPSVVLGEFLMPIPPKEVEKYWNLLNKYLMIASFDAIAAVEFAKIWQSKQKQEIIEQLKQEGMGKNYLKVDCMIVATAITRRATCIYSHDPGLKKFAEGHLEVREIPELPAQQSSLL